jgi:hypothetical protein
VGGGLSALLLGVFHQVIDAWERRSWATIFIWIGASAITLYFINGIVGFQPLATQLVGGDVRSFVDSHLTPALGAFSSSLYVPPPPLLWKRSTPPHDWPAALAPSPVPRGVCASASRNDQRPVRF